MNKAKYYIDVEMLERHNACKPQLDNFRETFGDRMDVTRANIAKALKAGLPLPWVADKLWTAVFLKGVGSYAERETLMRRASDLEDSLYDVFADNDAGKATRLMNKVGDAWAEYKALVEKEQQP